MSSRVDSPEAWTASDVVQRFGPILIRRLRVGKNGEPATVAEVSEIYDREERLYELVDGLLVEKSMGSYESMIATELIILLGTFIREHQLGKVLGESGMVRLNPTLVRIPDVCYISNFRFAAVDQRERVWSVVPDLVIEVLSDSNTAQEMDRKRTDYFQHGVRELWMVDSNLKSIEVFESIAISKTVRANEEFCHSRVLPGLRFSTGRLFA